MGPVEKGPFYAYNVYPGDVGTYGGVVSDTEARVVREVGSVIPGLYATGISTASVMGRCYLGARSSIGPLGLPRRQTCRQRRQPHRVYVAQLMRSAGLLPALTRWNETSLRP
jgi:hypothetical protein